MHKKGVIFPSRRAQVTVFIILGIVVFLIFVFLFYLSASIKRTELTGEREEVLGRAFNKEALRLFVTDCLEFALEKGLERLGQQGTLWRDQGGLVPFQEDVGVDLSVHNLGDRKVVYGIRQEKTDPDNQNLYPCNTATAGNCLYRFPDTAVGFGELSSLSIETYENDLAGFLKKEARACAEEWITGEIYPGAQVQDNEAIIDMDVTMTDTSILIAARYPLTFVAAGEEYFHLFEFGLDYDSQLRQFLEAAVIYPLRWDWRYVDFDFDEDTLLGERFLYGCVSEGTCYRATFADRWRDLDVRLDSPPPPLDNGDTLFTFTVNKRGAIIKNKESYAFTIARQNRPPALDHIGQFSAPQGDYDYVLQLGEDISITPSARDPDEDFVMNFDFSLNDGPSQSVEGDSFSLENIGPDIHLLTVTVTDEHGASDAQRVRIFVQGGEASE